MSVRQSNVFVEFVTRSHFPTSPVFIEPTRDGQLGMIEKVDSHVTDRTSSRDDRRRILELGTALGSPEQVELVI